MIWEESTINDCFEFVRNGTSIKQEDGKSGIPITRIETIWGSYIDSERLGYADIHNINGYENYVMKIGDILMSHINSPKHLGKNAIYQGSPELLIHGMNLLCLRPNEKIFPKYAFYYFNSLYFKSYIPRVSNQSVNQASFSAGKLKDIPIPLPPLEVQKKIAEILDAAHALRKKTQQIIEHYDQLAQSIFLDMFGDPVTNPKGWEFKCLGDLQKIKCQNGHYAPKDDYSNKGIQMVHMSDAFYNKVSPGNLKRVIVDDKLLEKYRLQASDLLLSRRSLNYEGSAKPCFIPEYFEPIIYESSLIRIRPNTEILDTIFLYYYLSNNRARSKYVFKHVTKSTISGINNKGVNSIQIYIPLIELQNEFAEKIELIEQQKELAKQSLQQSEDLFNALLQKAFKGELIA